jgi:biopolymer transport protein ExbB
METGMNRNHVGGRLRRVFLRRNPPFLSRLKAWRSGGLRRDTAAPNPPYIVHIIFYILCGLFFLAPLIAHADAPSSLQQLLEQVKQEKTQSRQAEREAEFRAARDRQKDLLARAKAALAQEKQRALEVQARLAELDQQVKQQADALQQRSGDLQEVFEIARQVAGETAAILETSLVSAQLPSRAAPLRQLAQASAAPTLEQLRQLWQVLLEEMAASGQVARFTAPVINPQGEESRQPVVRVGTFTAVSNGYFLRWLSEAGRLAQPARQPGGGLAALAREFERASSGMADMVADPSRGSLLTLLAQAPSWRERIEQGGEIGYLIMALGGIGLLLALERWLALAWTQRKIRRQLRLPQPQTNNPLGRILQTYNQLGREDPETLSLKIDEAILKELPGLRRGLDSLGVIATIAPLLGLLGTVTGMIRTFQAITLFGTGDPRVLSDGIAEALVTTVQGLAVAIPVLLLHSLLSGKSEQMIHLLDEQSAALIARRAEAGHAGRDA